MYSCLLIFSRRNRKLERNKTHKTSACWRCLERRALRESKIIHAQPRTCSGTSTRNDRTTNSRRKQQRRNNRSKKSTAKGEGEGRRTLVPNSSAFALKWPTLPPAAVAHGLRVRCTCILYFACCVCVFVCIYSCVCVCVCARVRA